MLTALFFTLSGYLLGSILFAEIAAKIFHKDIISKSPDKNYGTANAYRYGGFFCGAFTLLFDMAKGFFPVFLYLRTDNPSMLFLPIVMVSPVIGHILPIFSRFKGGKAIAVTFGSLMGFFPDWSVAVALALFFLFFTLIIRISPHCYRTILSYILATVFAFIFEPNKAIGVGMIFITVAVSMKMMSVEEERGKFEISWLWRH